VHPNKNRDCQKEKRIDAKGSVKSLYNKNRIWYTKGRCPYSCAEIQKIGLKIRINNGVLYIENGFFQPAIKEVFNGSETHSV
jgi:hypothetical protein